MCNVTSKTFATLFLSTALMCTTGLPARADDIVTVPTGTVIPLRMETYLNSESSRVGDRFEAGVLRNVEIDGRVAIPAGSKVEGRVTSVTRADRKSKAGTIAIAFDRLIFLNGPSITVDGTLTTLDDEARAKLERADEEGRVEGASQRRRAIIFIGGGAGLGAVIGAIAGGGKGAAVGAGVGAVLGTIGTLLSKGDDAEVKPGTEFGMMVERAFTVNTDANRVAGERYDTGRYPPDAGSDSDIITSSDSIRGAQAVLRDRGYYTGAIDGRQSFGTRNAIRQFQRDRNLPVTGELDVRTAKELGVISSSGYQTILVSISNPRAEWVGRNSIRVYVDAHTPSGGWQVFADHVVSGNTLHVYVRGVRPQVPSGPGTDHHVVNETFHNVAGVTRVTFHGAERDFTIDLAGNSGGAFNPDGTGDARQISILANRLLADYQRDLNVRGGRNQLLFDPNRNFRQGEIDLLSQIYSLAAAADLYNQMVGRVNDENAIKDAADGLLRQARLVNRVIRRSQRLSISRIVQSDWDQLRTELARITVTSNDLDADIDRFR